ncbi:MAG: hypothetical protein AB7O50_06650 [Pseudolabrys sp.]
MREADAAATGPVLSYSYRPSVLGSAWQFRLTDDALFWDIGYKSGRVDYRDIERVRMSYRPATMQGHRFITELWPRGHPKLNISSASWKSLVEQERLDADYSGFLAELHRRVARSGAGTVFETGGHPARYWAGITMFAATALGLAAMTARAVQLAAWGGAALIGLFLLIFLWQAGNYFRRNRPGRYDPENLPAVLLP